MCDLFVVYESNNYGTWKTRIMRWFHGVFIAVYEDWLRFIVTHCYLFVSCLWFMNPISMESVKSQKYGDFMVFLLRFMKIDWDLLLLIVTYVWFVCGLWIQSVWNL